MNKIRLIALLACAVTAQEVVGQELEVSIQYAEWHPNGDYKKGRPWIFGSSLDESLNEQLDGWNYTETGRIYLRETDDGLGAEVVASGFTKPVAIRILGESETITKLTVVDNTEGIERQFNFPYRPEYVGMWGIEMLQAKLPNLENVFLDVGNGIVLYLPKDSSKIGEVVIRDNEEPYELARVGGNGSCSRGGRMG